MDSIALRHFSDVFFSIRMNWRERSLKYTLKHAKKIMTGSVEDTFRAKLARFFVLKCQMLRQQEHWIKGIIGKRMYLYLAWQKPRLNFARTTAKTYNIEMDKSILKWLSGRGVSPRDLTSVRFSYWQCKDLKTSAIKFWNALTSDIK